MTTLIATNYEPTARQTQAHEAWPRWTLYGGAEGGGKTRWLVEEMLDLMLEYPGIEGIAGRYDMTDVTAPTQLYQKFHETCPPGAIGSDGIYKSSPVWTRLKNGSRLTFSGFKDYSASAEFGFVGIDQCEEVPEETIRLLDGRIRQDLPDGSFPHFRMLLTCNPHPNAEWILDMARRQPGHCIFIPALPVDNPFLPDDFFDVRRISYTEDQFKRLIEGSWDVFTGQAISEFNRNVHVIPPFDTWREKKWAVYRGIDYGLSSPTICEWLAVSPDGDWYFVQEYDRSNEVPIPNAQAIAAMSLGLNIRGSWIDPRTAETKADLQKSTDWSVFDEYQKQGVHCQLARGSRVNRLAAWKQALKLDPTRRNPLTMETPAPKLYIFSNCTRLIWELPRLQYRDALQGYGDDIVKQDDHAYDAGGFVLAHIREAHAKQGPGYAGIGTSR